MKVRRRTGGSFGLERILAWLNPMRWFNGIFASDRSRIAARKGRIGQFGKPADGSGDVTPGGSAAAQPQPSGSQSQLFGPQSKGGTPSPEQPRYTAPNPMRLGQDKKNSVRKPFASERELNWKWLFGGTFIGSLLTGYMVAAVFFFPAPFFSSERPVPRVIDLPYEEAVTAIEGAGLEVGDTRFENHPSYARDQIVWQDPPEGVRVPTGTLVRLARSRGPQEIPVPDVSRYDAGIASMLIVRSGLEVRHIDSIQTALPSGVAVGTRPAAGATLSPGAGVILIVSRGAPTMSVPDLAGLTLEEAEEELELLGLSLGRSWQEFSNAQAGGLIFRQEPLAGTLIAPGTPINVVIARTP